MTSMERLIRQSWEPPRSRSKVCLLLILSIFLAVAVSSCTSEGTQDQNASNDGERLFKQSVIGGNAGCSTCHSLDEGVILVGPSLAGISSTAAQREPGKSAEEYIRESILKPDAFVLDGYPASVMPDSYGEKMTDEELNLIVEYLLARN